MWECAVRFRFEAKLSETEAKLFPLPSETEGFVSLVSLWSETVDFICEIKRKWSERSEKSEAERNERREAKETKRNKFGKILKQNLRKTASIYSHFEADGSETRQKEKYKRNLAKRKRRKRNKAKRKKWKQKMKWKEKYGSETKRKEKYRSKKKNTEAKQSEKKNLRSEKIYVKFSFKHAKRKWNESRFASFCFEAKKIWSETGAP